MVVLHSAPPSLQASETWSPEFRTFVDACLQKDPNARPSAKDLLTRPELRKFLDKAQDSNYILSNFLQGLASLDQRIGQGLKAQAKEYFEKRERKASINGPSGQRVVQKKANNKKQSDGWDFTPSSGGDPRKEESKLGDKGSTKDKLNDQKGVKRVPSF